MSRFFWDDHFAYPGDDFDDGYGSNHYARESDEINGASGHSFSCAWAGGGDCTCGLHTPEPDYPSDTEMEEAGWVRDSKDNTPF